MDGALDSSSKTIDRIELLMHLSPIGSIASLSNNDQHETQAEP
jgi:hypothetical protein